MHELIGVKHPVTKPTSSNSIIMQISTSKSNLSKIKAHYYRDTHRPSFTLQPFKLFPSTISPQRLTNFSGGKCVKSLVQFTIDYLINENFLWLANMNKQLENPSELLHIPDEQMSNYVFLLERP